MPEARVSRDARFGIIFFHGLCCLGCCSCMPWTVSAMVHQAHHELQLPRGSTGLEELLKVQY